MYSEHEIEDRRYASAQSLASARVEGCTPTIEDVQDFDGVICGTFLYHQFPELSLPESHKPESQVGENLIKFVNFV